MKPIAFLSICPVPEKRVCDKRPKHEAANHCLATWTADKRRVAQRLYQKWNGEGGENTECQKAKAGTAKLAEQPAKAGSCSVFSPLKFSDEAVIGSVASVTPMTASSLKQDVRLRWQCISRRASRSFYMRILTDRV